MARNRTSRSSGNPPVVPNGEGSEFVFTLIGQPGMSDGQFAKDKAAVENDLKMLVGTAYWKRGSSASRRPSPTVPGPCNALTRLAKCV